MNRRKVVVSLSGHKTKNDLQHFKRELKCLFLADTGLYCETIARAMGYSKGQVYYTLKKARKKLTDYRKGKNAYSKYLISNAGGITTEMLEARIRKIKLLS